MGDRLKEALIVIGSFLVGCIIVISASFLAKYIVQKNYEHYCDTIPITDAWKDEKCVEYFKKDVKELDEKYNK